ncbi:hypothetical protein TRICI_003874 [Trichomonascus ciferrii]|uniref:Nudix hydrolase domain-containing protein n=1 Tax=Trichomonascus ciferrii TaxID=44093 RepID=A0A642V3X3_9ASCO|nr:hypothetical protein TRICI_003874 [Trichomonascus ciferrii]
MMNQLGECEVEELKKAEILFIKRAESDRDRWSSHIALPGGKRDPEDASDKACATRETWEEVGLDLDADGTYVGPLDQRLVKVSWGSRTIMTLCPYVFLLNNPDVELKLQPSEISTAFWYPIHELMDVRNISEERVAVGDRMGLDKYWFIPNWLNSTIKWSVGKMSFQCVDLYPTEGVLSHHKLPYKLWGLTLAYMMDFFELMEPGKPILNFKFPTMQAWDMRLIISALSLRHKLRCENLIIKTLSGHYRGGNMDLVSKLLDGYFKYLGRGIAITLFIRFIAIFSAAAYILRRLRR